MKDTGNRDMMEQMSLQGMARYAEKEAVEKLLKYLSEKLGWSVSYPFCFLKKLVGDLVFEIDIHKGPRNRDYELVEVQCECNIWHRKFGRTLSANSLVGQIPIEPNGRRWLTITQTGQLSLMEREILRIVQKKVLPLQEDFSADPAQAVRHLVDRKLIREYDIHLVLIELYAGDDYALEVAQAYYDELPNSDKKRIQRHQGGETQITEAGNLLYIADQMYVRSGLLSWKKYDKEPSAARSVEEGSKPVREKSYYTSREDEKYIREIRRRLERRIPELAGEYGFKSSGGVLQRSEKVNIFSLQIAYAERGKTLTASLSGHPYVLDQIYWSVFDLQDMVKLNASGYVITETSQLRDLPLEDAKTEVSGPDYVENALRALLYWARRRVAFFEDQIDSVAQFREVIAGDSTQKMNRILCDIHAMHYREAMLSAQDMLRHHMSGGVAVVVSDTEQRDILEYVARYCRKKLYG